METKKKEFERKRGEMIPLKTDLPDVPFTNKLQNLKSQSINEILNQPVKDKKKFSFNFFGKRVRRGFLNNTMISPEMNKPLLNVDIFNSLEVLTEPTFKVAVNRSMSQEMNKSNTFKILLKENYTQYIQILKSKYPSFKFNHYNKYNKEPTEYFKKYGEEGDINNRHFNYSYNSEINSFRFNHKIKDDKEYKKSNLLEILGAQENIECDPKLFKIKDDFLSRTDCMELKMIQKDLQFKTGVVEKELDFILMTYPQKLYNYIENNRDLTKKLKEYQILLLQRRLKKKRVISNYISNSAKLIMKGHKIKQNLKFLKILKEIDIIYKSMQNLKMTTFNESENKIKMINDAINIVKDNLKKFNNKYNKDKKYKFIIEIEKIIQQYETQGEENLNDQFSFNIKKLLNNCLIYFDKNSDKYEKKEELAELTKKWDLSKENDVKNKIIFIENDFNFTEAKDNIFIKYLLIYNNLNSDNNFLSLLISILDMFEIIIKDNLDVNTIVSVFQDVFIKLVNKNYEIIQNITDNKLLKLKIVSNCFSIILSNYYYIIMLIQNNFGFRIKIFGEITELIKKEMDKNIIVLLNEYYNDIISVNHWKYFIYETKEIKKNIDVFFNFRNLNLFKLIIDKYKEYINNFKTEIKKELDDKIDVSSLNWERKKNIDIKYQKMFDILFSNKELTNLKFDELDISKQNLNDKIDSEFICINNDRLTEQNDINHKISIFSLEIINYVYNYLLVFVDLTESITDNNIIIGDNLDNEIDKGIRNDLILFMYNNIIEKLEDSKNIMINNKSGLINNKQITEYEISIYYSDLIIIQNILNPFLLFYPEQRLVSTLNNLTTSSIDLIAQLVNETINKINDDFKSLNFKKYPIINGGKGYNNYVNYFTILKRIYDNMNNCFNKDLINKIFKEAFSNLFNKMNEIMDNKGIIEEDEQLKQFRSDLNYIKKVFRHFPMINCDEFKDLIEKFIIKINPNKLPTTKKKKGTKNKEKEENAKEKEENVKEKEENVKEKEENVKEKEENIKEKEENVKEKEENIKEKENNENGNI